MGRKSTRSSESEQNTIDLGGQKVVLPKLDENYLKKLKKEEERKLKDLQLRSKALSGLLVIEEFTIENIIVSSHHTYITPRSEIVVGGSSSSYKSGFTANSSLFVIPTNLNVPVRQLIFRGHSALKGGDYIRAVIPCYDKEEFTSLFGLIPGYYERGHSQIFYLERALKEEESAIELVLLDKEKRSLRTERSVNYNKYQKE